MEEEQRRRIEETVVQILKASDLETATEFSVRAAAAERLGFEISGLAQRRLVHQLIDFFLLSNAASILGTTPAAKDCGGGNKTGLNGERYRKQQQQQRGCGGVGLQGNDSGKVICKLSEKRWVTIHDLNGTTMVGIRDFFSKDGNMLPSKAPDGGINLPKTQWSSFRNSFSAIEEAIVNLESQLRKQAVHHLNNLGCGSEAVREADLTNSVANSVADKSHAGEGISHLTDMVKRKRTEREPDISSAMADSATENSRIKACMSDSTRIVRPRIERGHAEADTSPSNALNSQEHIYADRKLAEAGVSESVSALESRKNANSERKQKQTEAQPSPLLPTFHTQGPVHDTATEVHSEQPSPAEIKETESDISTALPTFPPYGKLHPERLTPIQTARFDGRNFHAWRHHMEIFLNQLNIAYVLTEPCPRICPNLEAILDEMVKVQRWIDDDYLCRHHILNSLCDSYFRLYSQKVQSARELWEDLNVAYNEDFGTKRSQINKYIHFQIVDGVSIVDQVNELHKIAKSIMASGTWIDENFHVSVIISKLPPGWKDFRLRLMMQEEFVPFHVLMHQLQVEEESRNGHKKEYKNGHSTELRLDYGFGIRKRENKRVCYYCGKEGHLIRNCFNRKVDASTRSDKREHNGVSSPRTGDKIGEATASTE